MYGNEEIVQFFLDNKETYKIDMEWICCDENKYYPVTAIKLAISNKQIQIAKLLFQQNVNLDNVSNNSFYFNKSK